MADLLEITRALKETQHAEISFVSFDSTHEEQILTLVGLALADYELDYLENVIATVLNEMINNASKANLKRVYFNKFTKDINNKEEYLNLIQSFKDDAVVRIKEYHSLLEQEDMKICFQIDLLDDGILLSISNNVEMTEEEKIRSQVRLENASKLKNMSEAFDLFASDEEGAGLGIVLNIQLMKNAGIDSENFRIDSKDGTTTSQIKIPYKIKKSDNLESIYNRVMKEITGIPVFSNDIQDIINRIQNDDYKEDEIIKILEKDTGLVSEILKEANSSLGKQGQFDTLTLAIKEIGKDGLYQAITSCSTRKILQSRYSDFHKFWNISKKCAFYARGLANILNQNVSYERLYLAGMFHNLGKLIIFSLEPELSHSLINTTIEEIELGVSHAQIGSLVAEKWGYSFNLVSLIKNYTRPMTSPLEMKLEASILHLSDYMIRSEMKRDKFVFLDIFALAHIGIKDREELARIHEELRFKFEQTF